MLDEFEITITSEEPPTSGANVTVRYGNVAVTSNFSLSAVAAAVAELNAALLEEKPAVEILQAAGGALFEALFGGRLLRTYMRSTALAAERGRRVRLRLNSQLPAIVAVPWEYLYDRDMERWLALHDDVSLVRSLPLAGGEPLAIEGNLRVLVMVADPNDLPPLDSAREWMQLQEATAVATIDLIRVEPTYEALQGALRRYKPHIFHFVGHGDAPADGYDGSDQAQGLLALCTGEGKSDPIPAGRLASLLASCGTLRLVLLNTCHGAGVSTRTVFAGVAQKLIQQGIPVVIAMQAPIYDDHALRFTEEFYRALADGYSVEQAMHQGRIRINEVAYSWGIPALYFQQSEPFAIQPLDDVQKAARLWQKAQKADVARRRPQLERILQLDPTHVGANHAMQQLARLAEAEQRYAEAMDSIKQRDWRAAHRTLEQVERLAPNYRDTRVRLGEIFGHLGALPALQGIDPDIQRLHVQPLLNALKDGRLVPFLGWEAGRFGRLAQDGWVKGYSLPGMVELARTLAEPLGSFAIEMESLLQVSQYTTLLEGEEALYERLYALYAATYPPTILHRLLAELPGRLRALGYPSDPDRRFVIFTTAFDDLLERAFAEVGQPYHLFAYRHRYRDDEGVALPECFIHVSPSGDVVELTTPNTYTGHDGDRHPILVKLCGRRVTPEPGSVVITEDDYLEYLPAQEVGGLLPATLLKQVNRRSFVFLGYDLQPWYFRLIWQRMKHQKRALNGKSWAIQLNASEINQRFWRKYEIEPLDASPEILVATVNEWLDSL